MQQNPIKVIYESKRKNQKKIRLFFLNSFIADKIDVFQSYFEFF